MNQKENAVHAQGYEVGGGDGLGAQSLQGLTQQDNNHTPGFVSLAGNTQNSLAGNKEKTNAGAEGEVISNSHHPCKQIKSVVVEKTTMNTLLQKRDRQQMSVSSKPTRQGEKGNNPHSSKKPPRASPPSPPDDSNRCSDEQYDFETVSDQDEDDDQGHSGKNTANRREQKKSTKLGRPRSQKEPMNDEIDDDEYDDEADSHGRKNKRLVQNRKSAQKCRLKKKAEFSIMRKDIQKYKEENISLKDKLNEVTIMLYNKIEENQYLTKKIDQNQTQHTMFLTKLLLNWHQSGPNTSIQSLQSQIQNHLVSCIDNNIGQRYVSSMQKNLIEQQATDQNNLNSLINQYLQNNGNGSPTLLNKVQLASEKMGSTSGSTAMSQTLKQLQAGLMSESQVDCKPQFHSQLMGMQSDAEKNPLLASILQQQSEINNTANKISLNSNNSAFTELPRRDPKGNEQTGLPGTAFGQNIQNTPTLPKASNEDMLQYANQMQMMHNLTQAKSLNNSATCSPMIPNLNNGTLANDQLQGLMQQNAITKGLQQKSGVSQQQVLKALLGSTSSNQNGTDLMSQLDFQQQSLILKNLGASNQQNQPN